MAITIEKDVYDEIFASKVWGRAGLTVKIEESVSEAPQEEVAEAEEVHACPLCESKLESPISEEKMQEHINYILDVINENFEVEGDVLEEELEETETEAGE